MNHFAKWSFSRLATGCGIIYLLFAVWMAQQIGKYTAVWQRESGTVALVGFYLLLLAPSERVLTLVRKHLFRKSE